MPEGRCNLYSQPLSTDAEIDRIAIVGPPARLDPYNIMYTMYCRLQCIQKHLSRDHASETNLQHRQHGVTID